DTPPQNRPLLATPRPGCEVRESSAAAVRGQDPLWLMESIAVMWRLGSEILRGG
nr:hypothetical protein [Tanacetum cinerariifolium]